MDIQKMNLCYELVLRYNYVPKTIVTPASVVMDENCNGVFIINTGATLAQIDNLGIPLNAGVPGTSNGDSFSIGGNKGELFHGRLDISFPATGAGIVVVVQKIYLPDEPLKRYTLQ